MYIMTTDNKKNIPLPGTKSGREGFSCELLHTITI